MKRIFKKITAILLSILVLPIFLTKVLAEDNEKQIGERELEAIERIMQGFEGFAESIDISDLNIERGAMPSIFATATKNTPYLFYVDKKLTYTYRTGGGVIKVIPKYNMSKSEAEAAIDLCKTEVKKMADLALRCETELQRLLLAHDLICYRYKYDLSLENNNVYITSFNKIFKENGILCMYKLKQPLKDSCPIRVTPSRISTLVRLSQFLKVYSLNAISNSSGKLLSEFQLFFSSSTACSRFVIFDLNSFSSTGNSLPSLLYFSTIILRLKFISSLVPTHSNGLS